MMNTGRTGGFQVAFFGELLSALQMGCDLNTAVAQAEDYVLNKDERDMERMVAALEAVGIPNPFVRR
jgi:hypothetical protein